MSNHQNLSSRPLKRASAWINEHRKIILFISWSYSIKNWKTQHLWCCFCVHKMIIDSVNQHPLPIPSECNTCFLHTFHLSLSLTLFLITLYNVSFICQTFTVWSLMKGNVTDCCEQKVWINSLEVLGTCGNLSSSGSYFQCCFLPSVSELNKSNKLLLPLSASPLSSWSHMSDCVDGSSRVGWPWLKTLYWIPGCWTQPHLLCITRLSCLTLLYLPSGNLHSRWLWWKILSLRLNL